MMRTLSRNVSTAFPSIPEPTFLPVQSCHKRVEERPQVNTFADAVYSLSDLTSCVHSSLNEAENARYMLRHPRKSEGKTPVNTSKEG